MITQKQDHIVIFQSKKGEKMSKWKVIGNGEGRVSTKGVISITAVFWVWNSRPDLLSFDVLCFKGKLRCSSLHLPF